MDLQHLAGDRRADARLVEDGLRQRHLGAGGDQPGLQPVGGGCAGPRDRRGERRLLLPQAVDGIGVAPAGAGEVLAVGVVAIGGDGIVELEARRHDGAFRRVDGVLGLVDAVAAGRRGLAVALALAHRRLGLRGGKAGASLLVLEPDQDLALGDAVVHLDGHLLHPAADAGADADLARARLDASRGGRDPGQLARYVRGPRCRGRRGRRRVELDLDGVARRHDQRHGKAGKAQRGETRKDGKLSGHSASPLSVCQMVSCHRMAACRLHGSNLILWGWAPQHKGCGRAGSVSRV